MSGIKVSSEFVEEVGEEIRISLCDDEGLIQLVTLFFFIIG